MNAKGMERTLAIWLPKVLAALRSSAGIEGHVTPESMLSEGMVELAVNGTLLTYTCEFKVRIPHFAALADMKARTRFGPPILLITPAISQEMALRCRTAGVQFLDSAGNAYLSNGQGMFIFVAGLKAAVDDVPLEATSLTTPAALRMVLAFLAKPPLINAPYREISWAAKVSTGSIGHVFHSLAARNFLATTGTGRHLKNERLLIGEWSAGYANRLRPKLERLRFATDNVDRFYKWRPTPGVAAWGGEMAAAIITKHLKPQQLTIYLDMHVPGALNEIVTQFRLRKDNQGAIEIVQPFWELDALEVTPGIAPLPLVYADLLVSGDPRNIEVASHLLEKMNDA
ncbi:type IV toxin-antitoxin system AbiEi family antitoxin [Pseudoduganella lutea]|uniref:Uncharacterized protein n=1 Tax=Pseudoduganella lutea TaxID=321985 RepID=A0A4P6KVU5_9BURK|nr:type IV toxin-antitoxin system AbiEi family antitoxin [Pseudoduganella lutea]QBE63271.1 hypothetical protein EWM63_10115 [Pseudoduganella lutea]